MTTKCKLLRRPTGRSVAELFSKITQSDSNSSYGNIISRKYLFISMLTTQIVQCEPLNNICCVFGIGYSTVNNDCLFDMADGNQKINLPLFYMESVHLD